MDGKALDKHENSEAENQGSFSDDNITHHCNCEKLIFTECRIKSREIFKKNQ